MLVSSQSEDADADGNAVYKIEGKVFVENEPIAEWGPQTRIIVNGGEYVGFLKPDGSFVVSNVPPGSHVVEVSSPNHGFQPARVEISSKSKGKMRARRVDWLQPGVVQQIRYPLHFKTKGKAGFFEKRETWHWTDSLMNPMVHKRDHRLEKMTSCDVDFLGAYDALACTAFGYHSSADGLHGC